LIVTEVAKDHLVLRTPGGAGGTYTLKDNWRDVIYYTQEECVKATKKQEIQTQPIQNSQTQPIQK